MENVFNDVECEVEVLIGSDVETKTITMKPVFHYRERGQELKTIPIKAIPNDRSPIDEQQGIFLYEIAPKEKLVIPDAEIGFGWTGTLEGREENVNVFLDGENGLRRMREMPPTIAGAKVAVGLSTSKVTGNQEREQLSQRMLFFGDAADPNDGNGLLLDAGQWFAFDTKAREEMEMELADEGLEHVYLVKYFADGQTLFHYSSIESV